MKRIFAIGGGEIRNRDTLTIDRELIAASGKKNPKILFIPTASIDAEEYVESVRSYFGNELGCTVDVLYLLGTDLSFEEIRKVIFDSHIIYVGGGNTKIMMKTWRRKGIDSLLLEACEKGIILSGLSAGSICWFNYGQSDSDTIATGEKQPYCRVKGLGLIPLLHAPHHNENDREADLDNMILETGMTGLALSNRCALEIRGEQFRILKSSDEAYALKLSKSLNHLIKTELGQTDEYRPISQLFE